jgi:hypothetical protein
VSDGSNSATYSYLTNSALHSQIQFKGANLRLTTVKAYDFLDRMSSIQSSLLSPFSDNFDDLLNCSNLRKSADKGFFPSKSHRLP